ncbi:MAG: hypothetical protein U0610_29445 [bacterium]
MDLAGLSRHSRRRCATLCVQTDGTRVTLGLVQYPKDGHYTLFDNPEGTYQYGHFLGSCARTIPIPRAAVVAAPEPRRRPAAPASPF